MIRAGLNLWEATGDQIYLEDAQSWTKGLGQLFWNEEEGGYFYTGSHATDLIRRTFSAADDATPNANATMIGNLSKLYAATGDETYRTLGDKALAAFTPQILASGIAHAGALNGFEDFTDLVQIVVVGDPASPDYAAMKQRLMERSIPNRFLLSVDPGASLPEAHPASGKTSEGPVTVYVCKGPTCSLPITDPEDLDQALTQVH